MSCRGRTCLSDIPCSVVCVVRQVVAEIEKLCPEIRTVCLYGGSGYQPQVDALRRGVDIVVATPGRLMDLTEYVVLPCDIRACCCVTACDLLPSAFDGALHLDGLLGLDRVTDRPTCFFVVR